MNSLAWHHWGAQHSYLVKTKYLVSLNEEKGVYVSFFENLFWTYPSCFKEKVWILNTRFSFPLFSNTILSDFPPKVTKYKWKGNVKESWEEKKKRWNSVDCVHIITITQAAKVLDECEADEDEEEVEAVDKRYRFVYKRKTTSYIPVTKCKNTNNNNGRVLFGYLVVVHYHLWRPTLVTCDGNCDNIVNRPLTGQLMT